jgi:hypothetical protein
MAIPLNQEGLRMKKLSVVLVVAISLCLVASFAFAGEVKGVVKSVDAAKGAITITVDGKDEALKAEKSVDLSKLKAGDKVEVTIEKDMVTSLKVGVAKPMATVGC